MRSLIYLVRHGAVDMPVPRRFLGQADPGLNELGIRQARALARGLAPIPFTRVVTSPLRRAMETASLVSGIPPDRLHPVAALQEINLGGWEGLEVAEIKQWFPGEYEQRGKDLEHFRPQGGESFADLADRCWPAFVALTHDDRAGPVLLVAHAGVNRVILSRLLGRSLQQVLDIPQEHCRVNIIENSPQGPRVVAINLDLGALARTPHLELAQERSR